MLPAVRSRSPLVEWDPFAELERTADRLTRLIDQTFNDGWATAWFDGMAFRPAADLEETDDAYIIEVELPGVAKSDIDVDVTGRRVRITGERKERERKGVLRRRTRITGRFEHEIVLPGDIDVEAVTAKLADGVLTVTAPKAEAERGAHRVTVQ